MPRPLAFKLCSPRVVTRLPSSLTWEIRTIAKETFPKPFSLTSARAGCRPTIQRLRQISSWLKSRPGLLTLPQTYEKLTGLLSASGWGWLACATWTLLCVSLLARMAVPQRRSVFTFCAVLSIFVLIDSIAAIALSSDPLHQAVVIDKNASALISPFPSAQTVFSPSPGETLTVQKSYDDFLLVKDSAGHTGWISKMQITPIVPPAAG